MSEIINNREYRQKVLKEIITELHNGKSVEDVKARFEKLIEGVSATEISEMEQSLILEGMPVTEIQRMCDVHAAVFKGTIEEIHSQHNTEQNAGHPVETFKLENREIEKLISKKVTPHIENFKSMDSSENVKILLDDINTMWEADKHFLRKENLLFPFLEKYGITAPPKVMWGVDDEIRDAVKAAKSMLMQYNGEKQQVLEKLNEAVSKMTEMIFKEENILFPMAMETLTEDEWLSISEGSQEIGYSLISPKGTWKPVNTNVEQKLKEKGEQPSNNGYVRFDAGILTPEEINAILNTLPIDMTFVDKDGAVKYFSQGKERIFARTKAIIGRQVQNCHPPASVHIVEKVVEDLKEGRKEHEDFWLRMGDRYVFIRYYAVRNPKGEFIGILEVTQDIKPIQEITGEKRLAD